MKLRKRIDRAVIFGAALALVGVPVGCRHPQPKVDSSGKQYALRGTVVSTDAAKGSVLLDHEAIPGFMPAMTMDYRLEDSGIVSELHDGDRITATLTVRGSEMNLNHIVVVAQARPDTKPKMQYHVPAKGDEVPDVPLLNQSGRTIQLSNFEGKVVLLTFVYTRCPLANFCPQMSRNFAEIEAALMHEPQTYLKTHLLSISFDPEYDTPAVLKSYGGAYTGRYSQETFTHWDFAAPRQNDLTKLEQFFDLGVTPGEGKTLNHSLATVIVGKDGRVVAFYPTNDWKVEDVLREMRAAVNAK